MMNGEAVIAQDHPEESHAGVRTSGSAMGYFSGVRQGVAS